MQLYFLILSPVFDPQNGQCLMERGRVLTLEHAEALRTLHGVDSFECKVCMGDDALAYEQWEMRDRAEWARKIRAVKR